MANFCVRYGNRVFVMANSKIVVFFMVKNRCVCYGCVRYDGTPFPATRSKENSLSDHPNKWKIPKIHKNPKCSEMYERLSDI